MMDAVKEALKRLEVDVRVARENWDTNPFLAMGALLDLEDGAKFTSLYLEMSGDAQEVANTLPEPTVQEVKTLLREAYLANGVDLSHFDRTCECHAEADSEEGLPNPYAVSVLPANVKDFIEGLEAALGVKVVRLSDLDLGNDPDKP